MTTIPGQRYPSQHAWQDLRTHLAHGWQASTESSFGVLPLVNGAQWQVMLTGDGATDRYVTSPIGSLVAPPEVQGLLGSLRGIPVEADLTVAGSLRLTLDSVRRVDGDFSGRLQLLGMTTRGGSS